MQNTSTPGPTVPATNNTAYSPSVPISVHREVTAELQATQLKLESFQTHNQQLLQQNQQLRQEIEKLLRAAMQLQQTVNSVQVNSQGDLPQRPSMPVNNIPKLEKQAVSPLNPPPVNFQPESYSETSYSAAASLPAIEPEPTAATFPEHLFTEVPDEGPYRPSTSSKQSPDIGGVWLFVAIALIVVAFFGAGYWVVRPLLPQQQQ